MSNDQTWEDPDLDEMKTEYETANSFKRLPTYEMVVGRNVLRVLPARKDSGTKNPFKKFWMHEINSGTPNYRAFQCPQETLGQACPACEKVSELYRTGNEADKVLANKMRVKVKAYANVVDMAHPEKGVQVLRVSEPTYRDLVGFMVADDKTGEPGVNYTHPIKGMSVIVNREGTGQKTKYKCELSRAGSKPLGDMAWLDQMHDLSEAERAMAAEQVLALLNGDGADAPKDEPRRLPPQGSIEDDPDLV